jgi:hypothetical protein
VKQVLVIAMALGLSACGSIDFFGDSPSEAPVTADTSVQARPEPPAMQPTAPVQPAPVQSASAAQVDADDSVAAQPPPISSAPAASSSAHCSALAKQRAIDAAFQGEDGDTQESVYNRTYSDCVAWDLKHAYR